MSQPVPLNYRVAKAQVGQFIEGNDPSFYGQQNTPLSTIAFSNPGATTVTYTHDLTPIEFYEPPDPAVNVEYPN